MRYIHSVWLLLLFAIPTHAVQDASLGIDPARITVSGLSSGAQMAHQLHLAYSDLFSGAAMLAGGPFACADGSVINALNRCLGKPGTEIPLGTLSQVIREASEDGRLAALDNLADDPVWIFHGSLDNAVPVSVNDALVEIYQNLIPLQQIAVVTDIPAAHIFPADGKGTACDKVEIPFVGNCGYDAAGMLLQFLYPGLQQPDTDAQTAVGQVNLDGAKEAMLDDTAYLFVPPACKNPDANCALHMVLHGCAQSASQVQTAFIEQSGYLEWADMNHIVLAFPQAVASAVNPLACWDWWGYSDKDYLWRNGKQMKVLTDWIKQLAGL